MASITVWMRLESDVRGDDMRGGLEARVHDPLWTLGRQWQTGEFRASDGGSPISVRLRHSSSPLGRFQPLGTGATGKAVAYDARRPLEAVVEAEMAPSSQSMPLRLRCESGQHFLRMVELKGLGHLRAALLAAFRLPDLESDATLDDASRRYLRLMRRRTVDGSALLAHVEGGASFALGGIPPADRASLRPLAREWASWLRGLTHAQQADSSAWVEERQEYAFAVSAKEAHRETVYTASEYTGGTLDWYSFGHDRKRAMGTTDADGDASVRRRDEVRIAIPAPVTYAGMPRPRFWEMEDEGVMLADASAGPEDLLQMVLTEFSVAYSNDWFLVPLKLPVGTVTRLDSLIVTDTFGERVLIPYSGTATPGMAEWNWFEVTGDDTGILLPPVLPRSLEGDALEKVVFMPDEMANVAWAVEDLVQNRAGFRADGASLAGSPPPLVAPAAGALGYQLATRVPANWHPLVPAQSGVYRLGRMADQPAGAMLGLILRGLQGNGGLLHREEVPRTGATVTRNAQYARWSDGSVHAWVGRRKRAAGAGRTSGLAFDVLSKVTEG